MDRGAWWATPQGCKELHRTEQLHLLHVEVILARKKLCTFYKFSDSYCKEQPVLKGKQLSIDSSENLVLLCLMLGYMKTTPKCYLVLE